MKVHFWGVRGSLPTPMTPSEVQEKITAVVSRITENDIKDEDSRMKFLASLPPWLYGTVGGNTACVEVTSKNGTKIILDCGSGLRVLAKKGEKPENLHYNIILSHFHWDHIQGFPFFDASFNPNATIDIYSAYPAAERILAEQSKQPYFPKNATWEKLGSHINFHLFKNDVPFEIDGVPVCAHKMNHPGNSYSVSFEEDGKKLIYATDVELRTTDYDRSIKENYFFDNTDLLILDAQYTLLEAIQKENWGHSSVGFGVDFANVWNVKNLYMFHHEPTYDDKKIFGLQESAKQYIETKENCKLKVFVAQEDQEITL